jgi:hypothetical protein
MEALPKPSTSLCIRFNKDKKVIVPDDPTNSRWKGPSITNFTGEKSSGALTLKLLEPTIKITVELLASSLILPDSAPICSEQMSLKKLHRDGFVKTEVRLYSEKEHTHICSLFIELEKKGGTPPEISVNRKSLNKEPKGLSINFDALESIAK